MSVHRRRLRDLDIELPRLHDPPSIPAGCWPKPAGVVAISPLTDIGSTPSPAAHESRRRRQRGSISAIASPPSASLTATSISTRPRSWRGVNEVRATALDSSLVNPVPSASRRNPTLPAWATTAGPSRYRPASRPLSTLQLRSALQFEALKTSQSQVPLPDRDFRVSTGAQQRSPVNDAG